MKIEQIREMDEAAIMGEIENTEKEIMNLRMGNKIGTVDNPLSIRFRKRDVARYKTVLRQRALKGS